MQTVDTNEPNKTFLQLCTQSFCARFRFVSLYDIKRWRFQPTNVSAIKVLNKPNWPKTSSVTRTDAVASTVNMLNS